MDGVTYVQQSTKENKKRLKLGWVDIENCGQDLCLALKANDTVKHHFPLPCNALRQHHMVVSTPTASRSTRLGEKPTVGTTIEKRTAFRAPQRRCPPVVVDCVEVHLQDLIRLPQPIPSPVILRVDI